MGGKGVTQMPKNPSHLLLLVSTIGGGVIYTSYLLTKNLIFLVILVISGLGA
jgi:hypothetical protein